LKLALFKPLKSLLPIPFQDFEAEHFRSSSYDIAFCHPVQLLSILKPCLQESDVQWRSGHLTLKMRPMHGLGNTGQRNPMMECSISDKWKSLFYRTYLPVLSFMS